MESLIVRLKVNDTVHELLVSPNKVLLEVLRENLRLTGTKFGCGLGQCGTCTVLINNKAERSCMLTVDFVQGKKLTTIEGLATNGELHPVQKAFMQHDALQCGFCTPGMILNACSLLHENPEPSSQEIIDGMEENLCRCGTYGRIIEAVQTAAKEMEGGIKL